MTSAAHLNCTVATPSGEERRAIAIEQLVIAGWTGRNVEAMEAHIKELEELGIARPKTMPIFYRVAAALLTTADEIQVSGTGSSGEVEAVVVQTGGERLIGLGSDHTDRQAETINVSLSKQMCHKPVAPLLWRYADVTDHWDNLMLRAWAHEGGKKRLYQEGPIATMRHPDDLVGRYGGLGDGQAMFCGTLAFNAPVCTDAGAFEMELDDPVLGRKITHRYRVVPLPVEG